MIRRTALAGTVVSLLAIGAAYASAFLPGGASGWGAWSMSIGTAGLLVSLMVLGASRNGAIGKLWIPFAFVFIVLTVGFGVALSLPPVDPADPELWLGLPRGAAVVLYGVGLLPLFAVPVAYALTFEAMTLSEADLSRVRAAKRARIEASVPQRAPADVAEVG